MVGLPWEQHVAFLDDRSLRALDRGARPRGRARVRRPSGRPLLRGRERDPGADRPLARPPPGRALPRAALPRREGRGPRRRSSRTSTTRRPSTSSCRSSTSSRFNVYLESRERLEAYLARLQNLAGDRPLLMAEIGLDSRRNGRGFAGGDARLAGPQCVRVGLRGRVRLRVDGRVASRRARHRRLGLRPHRPRAQPEARARGGRATRSPTCLWLREDEPPLVSVVVCSYNGARDDPRVLRRPARARVPELRGDRRRRRLDRRAPPRSRRRSAST